MVKVNYVSDEKDVVLFDLYNYDDDIKYCGLSFRKSKKGDWFVSEPSYKARDGKYYKYYLLPEKFKNRLINSLIIHLESTNYSKDSAFTKIIN